MELEGFQSSLSSAFFCRGLCISPEHWIVQSSRQNLVLQPRLKIVLYFYLLRIKTKPKCESEKNFCPCGVRQVHSQMWSPLRASSHLQTTQSFHPSLERLWGLGKPHLWPAQVTPTGIIPDDCCSRRKRKPQPRVCRSQCKEDQRAHMEFHFLPRIPCQSPMPELLYFQQK